MATLPIQTEIDELATGLTFMPFRFSRNKTQHIIDAADTTLSLRAGLKYYLELQVPEYKYFGDFVALHRSEGREVPIEASSNGSVYEGAKFSFNEKNGKLDGCLEFVKPAKGSTKLMTVVNQTMQYRLREIVQQEDPEVDTDVTRAAEWMVKAGLHPIDFEKWEETFFSARQKSKLAFLTWQPDNQYVGSEERWLSFLLNFSPRPTSVKLKVRLIPQDNMQATQVLTIDTVKIGSFGQIVVAPVGVTQLGIDTTLNAKYEVWLSNQENKRITEVRTFIIDADYRAFERGITFINQLGGWDTVRFTGESSESLKVTRYTAERERSVNPGIEFVDKFVIDIEGEDELVISTGFFEKNILEQQKHLQSLMFSERIYLQTPKGHQSIELVNNQIEKRRDNPDIIAYQFVFKKSSVIQNYSDLEPSDATGGREWGWRAIDYKHVLDAFGKRTGKVIPQRLEKYYIDDNSKYKPYTVKPNITGTDGYIEELTLPNAGAVAGTTPFPSTEINRLGSYTRALCAVGTPGPATIIVVAAKYGGEKAGDADALAEAEAATMNTQAYADTNGACYPDPWSYYIAVPADKAHFRISNSKSPGSSTNNYVVKSGAGVSKGNAWFLQISDEGQPDVYINGTWDIQLPTNFAPGDAWKFGLYGQYKKITVWVNGVAVFQGDNGSEYFYEYSVAHNLITSQAKVYIQVF